MAAKKKASPAMQFVLDYLKRQPEAPYAEVADAASKKRLKIFPIMYGRAQTLLGHIPMSPRGQGKAARKKKTATRDGTGGSRDGTGGSRQREGASPALDSLESILAAMRRSEIERERYKKALRQIGEILDEVSC